MISLSPKLDIANRTTRPREKRWTVDEYLSLTQAGVFDEDGGIELLDGKIIEMAGMGTPHFMASAACRHVLTEALGKNFFVLQQLPVRLSDASEPEPDICVVRGGFSVMKARNRKPIATELALLIEVSDSTYDFDSTDKLSAYARAGIQEYWIVNLKANNVEQHTVPVTIEEKGAPRGIYRRLVTHYAGDVIETLELGSYAVAEVLG